MIAGFSVETIALGDIDIDVVKIAFFSRIKLNGFFFGNVALVTFGRVIW